MADEKITSTSQLRINGEKPKKLAKVYKMDREQKKSVNEVIGEYLSKRKD
jgi:hypothetical protein